MSLVFGLPTPTFLISFCSRSARENRCFGTLVEVREFLLDGVDEGEISLLEWVTIEETDVDDPYTFRGSVGEALLGLPE